MLPVLWMCHHDNQLQLKKAHSDRPMHHSFPSLITVYGAELSWLKQVQCMMVLNSVDPNKSMVPYMVLNSIVFWTCNLCGWTCGHIEFIDITTYYANISVGPLWDVSGYQQYNSLEIWTKLSWNWKSYGCSSHGICKISSAQWPKLINDECYKNTKIKIFGILVNLIWMIWRKIGDPPLFPVNSLAPGRCGCNRKLVILKDIPEIDIVSISCKISLSECLKPLLMISQYWFR